MKQNEVFNKIGGIIKELNDQYEYLQTVKDNLNDIELDLFASNAQFLTDHVEILGKLNLQNPRFKKLSFDRGQPAASEKFFEPVVQQMKNGNRLKESRTSAEPVKPTAVEKVKETTPEEQPVPEINLGQGSGEDTYSYIREERETVKHELLINEAQEPEEEVALTVEEISSASKRKKAETANVTAQHEETAAKPEIAAPISFLIEAPVEIEPETIKPDGPVAEAAPEPEQGLIKPFEPVEELISEKEEILIKPFEFIDEPTIKPIPKFIAEPEPVAEVPIPKIASESKTVEKAPEEEKLTINQLFSQMADKPASKFEQLTIKPISDIKLAITLNDKLLYVKDLFNGYNLAYSEAVEILNRFNTFEEAMRFLKTNYVTKNNWDAKPATTEKFYALLKRRYA